MRRTSSQFSRNALSSVKLVLDPDPIALRQFSYIGVAIISMETESFARSRSIMEPRVYPDEIEGKFCHTNSHINDHIFSVRNIQILKSGVCVGH